MSTPSGVREAAGRTRVAAARAVLTDTSTVLLVTQLLAAGTAFVANIVAARTLAPTGRGELALLLQIAYLATLGLLLGTDRSVVAVYSGRATRAVTRAALRLLVTPGSLVLAVAVVLLAIPVPGLGGWGVGLGLAAVFTVVNALTRAVRAVAIASDRRADYTVYRVCSEVLLLGSIGVFATTGVTSSAVWMIGYVVAGGLPTLLLILRWSRADGRAPDDGGTPTDDGVPDDEAGRRTRSRAEGLALLPATVAHSATLRIDRLLLAGLASTAALGIYASVATMTELIAWPLLAYADSRLGRWREAHDAGTFALRRILLGAVAWSVIAGVALGAAMSALLVPLLGPDYAPALALVGPLILAAGVFGLSQILVTALTAMRRPGLASVVEVIGVAVSLVGYVVMIARYEALGAAWGSVLGYSVVLLLAAVAVLRVRRARTASTRGTTCE